MSADFAARALALQARSHAARQIKRARWFALPALPSSPMASPPVVTTSNDPIIASPAAIRIAATGGGDFFLELADGLDSVTDRITRTRAFGNAVTYDPAVPSYARPSGGHAFLHDGQRFELRFIPNGAAPFEVRVDGQRIGALPLKGTAANYLFDFGSVASRRIDLILSGQSALASVAIDPTDSLGPVPLRGPRCVVMTDSYGGSSEGPDGFSYGSSASFVEAFAAAMGWDDVWNSSVGGSGYVQDAPPQPNWLDRVGNDVIAQKPDVVLLAGTGNDNAYPVARIVANARSTWSAIRDALPGTLIFAGDHSVQGNCSPYSTPARLDRWEAMRAAAAEDGVHWCSPIDQAITLLGSPLPQGTLTDHPNIGIFGYQAGRPGSGSDATSQQWGVALANTQAGSNRGNVPLGATIELGSGATRERLTLKNWHGAASRGEAGHYSFVGALQFAHALGEPWKMVGGSFVTGKGHVGAETGDGSADRYCGSDGAHPSFAGAQALGRAWAAELRRAMAALP